MQADGWNPWERWNMEYRAAARRYAVTRRPVRVSYEGLFWFEYDELDGVPFGDADMRELREHRRSECPAARR